MQVFLSYVKPDQAVVNVIAKGLQECGFRIWDNEFIGPGESVVGGIASGIRAADVVVVILGRDTTRHQWSMLEIGGAMASRKPIVPVLIDKNADIPLILGDLQYLDLSDPASRQERLGMLCDAVRRAPARADEGEANIALVEDASTALRREADEYRRAAGAREQWATRLLLVLAVVSVVAAAIALILASVATSSIVAAIAAGLGALFATALGFYFGSTEAPPPPKRGSQDIREHK